MGALKKQTRGNCFSLVFRCMLPYFSLFLLRCCTQWCSFLQANTVTTKPMVCAKFATWSISLPCKKFIRLRKAKSKMRMKTTCRISFFIISPYDGRRYLIPIVWVIGATDSGFYSQFMVISSPSYGYFRSHRMIISLPVVRSLFYYCRGRYSFCISSSS